jgi:hypothetical protein
MKPTPLPPNPTFLDRLEYGLEWLFCRFIIEPRGRPMLAGLATGVLTLIPVIGIVSLIEILLRMLHWRYALPSRLL